MKLHLLRKYSQFKSTVCLPSTAFPVKIKDKAKHEKELQQVCYFSLCFRNINVSLLLVVLQLFRLYRFIAIV